MQAKGHRFDPDQVHLKGSLVIAEPFSILLEITMFFLKLILWLGIVVCVAALALLWTSGITHMNEIHPDYKGEDFP